MDFLERASALFATIHTEAESTGMKCPYCTYEIAELWQPLCGTSDYTGKVLDVPDTIIRSRVRQDKYFSKNLELKWM